MTSLAHRMPQLAAPLQARGSPGKLTLALAGSLAFTAIGTVLVVQGFGRSAGFVQISVGSVGVLFFGLCAILIGWRLLSERGVLVTIGPQGIRDLRVSTTTFPWQAIQRAYPWSFGRQQMMILTLRPEMEEVLAPHYTRIYRWSRQANRRLGIDGICVTAAGLDTDLATMVDTAMLFARAAQFEERDPAGGSVAVGQLSSPVIDNGQAEDDDRQAI
ncbi:STM3941 family protein [Rhizobium halophytocola]|uniref:PH domain-containing protein n=1 Tax=Rhizobium halophytocola TaxID=735519 RepID=A0ABS4E4S2_9HYPH|nr:STM3941 family protein [Rhizobium halophytocola]MBP1852940.1 hypothetical protein [Rhizobium halophytocola]